MRVRSEMGRRGQDLFRTRRSTALLIQAFRQKHGPAWGDCTGGPEAEALSGDQGLAAAVDVCNAAGRPMTLPLPVVAAARYLLVSGKGLPAAQVDSALLSVYGRPFTVPVTAKSPANDTGMGDSGADQRVRVAVLEALIGVVSPQLDQQ